MAPKLKEATLKQIAERAGVTAPTVSRVLSGKAEQYRISHETVDLITRIAEELEYTPNFLASSLRLRKTYTLGLIIPDISNPFFSSLARSIEKSARNRGYSIILTDSEETTKLEIESFKLLESRKVDGLIVSPVGEDSEHFLVSRQQHLPIVLVDRYFPQLNFPYVASDNYRGATEAVRHLIDNGHRMIGCIQGIHNTSTNRDRVRGYVDALTSAGIDIDESLILGDNFGEENGYVETKLLLRRSHRPTAIFALGNLISLGVLRALSEEQVRIPEDVSLISFDDQPYFNYLSTPITTVAQQNKELGRIATKLLLEKVDETTAQHSGGILIPTKLIIRQSVKRLTPA